MAKEIILSDERVNRYGFRMMTAGIRLDNFLRNPIMTFNHVYGREKPSVIGRWVNLRKENGVLYGTPEFDMEDELGAKVASKYERGFLNAASITCSDLTMSDAPEFLLPRQLYPTVVASDLEEAAIVELPANPGSVVRLSTLNTADWESVFPFISTLKTLPTAMSNTQSIALSLGLGADATEAEIIAAIDGIKPKSPTEAKPAEAAAATQVSLSALLKELRDQPAAGAPSERTTWTFGDYERRDPSALRKLKYEQPTKYEALVEAYTREHVRLSAGEFSR